MHNNENIWDYCLYYLHQLDKYNKKKDDYRANIYQKYYFYI